MNRLYDTIEPCPIDEEMLMRAIEEQGPQGRAGQIAKAEGYDLRAVKALRLDFKNILKLGGLWELPNLTKLQLDNNIIEKIEGISTLVNLVWLDLSYNNIEVIEDLDSLTKLEDLSLFENRISRLENMDTLVNLQVFSIGNNQLKELENIMYLRRFKKLKTLNLSNNPLCDNEKYKLYVGAVLPHMKFLNYRLIDDQMRTEGLEVFSIQVDEILDKERKALAKELAAEEIAKELDYHTRAYVEYLNGPYLFEKMFADDPDGRTLRKMHDFDEVYVQFKEDITDISQKIFDLGLEEHEKREAEVALFWECVNEAKMDIKETSMTAINDFLEMKKKLFEELSLVADVIVLEEKVGDYNIAVTELWDKLMGLEMQLVDQLEEVIQNFERNLQDIIGNFIENLQGLLTLMRGAQSDYNEKVSDHSQSSLEAVARNEMDDDIPDDLRILCIDKDTLVAAIATSHDAHLLTIDNKEDAILSKLKNWMNSLIEKIDEEEFKRNRARVTEINHLIDHLREEIDDLEMESKLHY